MFRIRHAGTWLPLGVLLLLCTSAGGSQPAHSLAEMLAAAVAHNPQIAIAGAERSVADALQRKAQQPFAEAPSANVKYQTDEKRHR